MSGTLVSWLHALKVPSEIATRSQVHLSAGRRPRIKMGASLDDLDAKNSVNFWPILLVPVLFFAFPLILLFLPAIIGAWAVLVLMQMFAPSKLPASMQETSFLMHSAAGVTSGIRIAHETLFPKPAKPPPPATPVPMRRAAAADSDSKGYTPRDIAKLEADGKYEELQADFDYQ